MHPLSVCSSLLCLSICFSAMAKQSSSDTRTFSEIASSFQNLDFKQRQIQKEYLLQKQNTSSLTDLFEQQDYNITHLIQLEEIIALGRPALQLDSNLSNIVHTAGMTHLEDFIRHPTDKPFLSTKSPEYQDAFHAELSALTDVSRVLCTDDWVPFRLRADRELIQRPRPLERQNSFYRDIKTQAKSLLFRPKMQTAQARQR